MKTKQKVKTHLKLLKSRLDSESLINQLEGRIDKWREELFLEAEQRLDEKIKNWITMSYISKMSDTNLVQTRKKRQSLPKDSITPTVTPTVTSDKMTTKVGTDKGGELQFPSTGLK